MLRSVISKQVDLTPFAVCYQCVRWRRKPRWVPVAKSKLFLVPERPKVPEEENIELMRLTNNYKTYLRSLRSYICEESFKSGSQKQLAQLEGKAEEEEYLKCVQENEAWNARIALIREARLAEQAKATKEYVLQKLIAREQMEKKQLEKIEQIVQEEKLRASTYITAENIDCTIEEALANPVDPNFAIDLEGNIYRGRETRPDSVPLEEREKIQTSSAS